MKIPSRSVWLLLIVALASYLHGAQARNRPSRQTPPLPAKGEPTDKVPSPPELPEIPEPAEPPELPEPPEPPEIAGLPEVGGDMAARIQAQAERMRRDAESHLQSLRGGLARMQHNLNGAYVSAGGPQSFRALVLPGADAIQNMAGIKEELLIMGKVLEKALQPESERRANPFRLEFGPYAAGGRNDLDALYLDGYGAVFLLEVDYPLVADPVRREKGVGQAKPKDDAWEKARREVRGESDPDEPVEVQDPLFRAAETKPFDASRVEALRGRLLVALQQAHNLKCVREGETVTLVVSGPQSGNRTVRRVSNRSAAGSSGTTSWVHEVRADGAGAQSGSVMTLRVKRSDLEGLRAGRITAEDFAGKVTVSSRSESAVAPEAGSTGVAKPGK
jgi:hypothetical protein